MAEQCGVKKASIKNITDAVLDKLETFCMVGTNETYERYVLPPKGVPYPFVN